MTDELTSTLDVWRPSEQWTTLFDYHPFVAPLWVLLFDPDEAVLASGFYGTQWPTMRDRHQLEDHAVGYQTSVARARDRLVQRLEPLRGFGEAWRVFSLGRVLALSLAPIPADWPLRLNSSHPTSARGPRYARYLARAVATAARLATNQPDNESDALGSLMELLRFATPEGGLRAMESPPVTISQLEWPTSGSEVRASLLGTPRFCPSSHVDAMTRARKQWEASW